MVDRGGLVEREDLVGCSLTGQGTRGPTPWPGLKGREWQERVRLRSAWGES